MAPEPLQIDVPLTFGAQLDARAQHAEIGGKVFLMHDDRAWTYRQYRDESVRMAHFLAGRLGAIDDDRPGHVAMVLENHLELLSMLGGCGFGGLTLFGVNTGLRGEVLSGVVNQSRARVIVIDEKLREEVERAGGAFEHIAKENVLYLPTQGGSIPDDQNLLECMKREVGPEGTSLDTPSVDVTPDQNLMVIYTSGTTGLPKGINNNHFKLCATGIGVSGNMELDRDDVGYACMPLFHSNSIFVGFMPCLWVGGAMGIRERFTASGFVPDILRYGSTFWNYVGEPVHYVLTALEKQYGDAATIVREVANHPDNKLRYAMGNGAAAPDIDRFTEYMGLEDMYELYGSTEAAISTFRRKGDPRGCVGEVLDEKVKILRAGDVECPPAQLDADGKILNYEECVGEICRQAEETGLFQGYFDNKDANTQKYRDGVYHSGDLGHILMRGDQRYLFFDGRTDDWIRKDGENFSAGQVGRLLSEHPDVQLAVAYGVPCSVSDEHVMGALLMRPGASFDAQEFFEWIERQVTGASMDRKWFPDYVTVVDEFEYTQTQKVLVRNLKKLHFDLNRVKTPVWFRQRGDTTFRDLTRDEYQKLRDEFERREALDHLDR
ncbi:MAG: AMP-binding protein [Deltaproteobacteria bacterium]|nr:AMP-binding protein [Deltaproteobacteria bacterium]MBW2415540.1 AMP-binding protein [Deltaproteobacteria bacterium]